MKDFRKSLKMSNIKNEKLPSVIKEWAKQLWPSQNGVSLDSSNIINLMGNEIILVRRELEEQRFAKIEEFQAKIDKLQNGAMALQEQIIILNNSLDEAQKGLDVISSWREHETKASKDIGNEVNFFVDEELWSDIEEYAENLLKKIKKMRKGKV